MKPARAAFLVALCLLLLVQPARAHGMRTAYFELVETHSGAGLATLRFAVFDPALRFAIDGCTLTPGARDAEANSFTFVFRCPTSLAGRTIRAEGLGPIVTEAVVRAAPLDGAARSGVLREDSPSFSLPVAGTWRVAAAYLRLGIVHIGTGVDHILFLAALALRLWKVRSVLVAETAFTASHTLSFGAAALGWVHVPAAAAEACIALSLVLLARELCADGVFFRVAPAPPPETLARRGALLALLFGLVHGLGFAAGLHEIGLPDHDVGVALAGFGAGVEVGQVFFLVVLLLVIHRPVVAVRRSWLAAGGGLLIGSAGALLFIQRLLDLR